MNWFKSIWLSSEERAMLKEAKRKKENLFTEVEVMDLIQRKVNEASTILPTRPYRKVIYDGRQIQVIFNDGSTFSQYADAGIFKQVRSAKSEEEIYSLLVPKDVTPLSIEIETPEERAEVQSNSSIFDGNNEFEKKDGNIFMKGVGLAMPAVVATSFIEILEKMEAEQEKDILSYQPEKLEELQDNYHALKMFWLKLALNPLPQSREDLLLFVKKNDVRITKNGNIVLYRRIVSYKGKTDNQLTSFISQNYVDRKKQKKAHTHPRNYSVYKLEDGSLVLWDGNNKKPKGDRMGNLEQLYKDLPNQKGNTYTSWHSKGKTEIKIGGIYSIPDNEINLNNGLCAAGGLHAAAVDYDYGGFGDTPVVVLVNPSKAITVPSNEWKKLRTTEMFIAAVNNKAHGEHFDDGALSTFDEEYHDYTLGELEKAVQDKTFDGISIKSNAPAVSLVDLGTIKDLLKNRVKAIV